MNIKKRKESSNFESESSEGTPAGRPSLKSIQMPKEPSIDPYYSRLERIELFSTNQCYYIVGSNKTQTQYRLLKVDRTLIEKKNADKATSSSLAQAGIPTKNSSKTIYVPGSSAGAPSTDSDMDENSHTAKPTLQSLDKFLTEDPNVYTQEEIKILLDQIHDGNLARSNAGGGPLHGGLKPVVKAYGIVGFIRFLDCYYLTLITKRTKVGGIGSNYIYTIKSTETIPLKPSEQGPADDELDPSSVLLSMWNRGKRSVGLGLSNREIAELRYQGLYQVVDLAKNFFYSYTYDVTRSLQENFFATTTQTLPPPPCKDLYAWNYFLTQEFGDCLQPDTSFHWVIPIIHGALAERKVNDYGRSLNLLLIARRSRHFAGTRYLKRGANEQGKVANDVEHEQILEDESKGSYKSQFSSYCQMRGSIPTFWSQESSVTMPKPPIELNRVDPTYTATKLHFEDLFTRYSSPILVLDLVKQSEKRAREVRVGDEYRHAIEYLNTTIDDERHKIRYCALDYSHVSKHRNLDVSSSLNECSAWALNQTGFFCSDPQWKTCPGGVIEPFTDADREGARLMSEELGIPCFPMEQSGVLRTNCIDCLDRTNVAQFSAGVEVMGQQLVVMGIRSRARLDPSSTIVRVLIDMYVDIGDSVALQYGGSEAHKKVTADHTTESITQIGKQKEVLTSIRRYYSNAFTDRLKQDAMNLFLGYFQPYRMSIPLWEIETDYYLHNFHVNYGRGKDFRMSEHQRAFALPEPPKVEKERRIKPYTRKFLFHSSERTPRRNQVELVRNQCKTQSKLLSQWWRASLQANLKQRMWITRGEPSHKLYTVSKYDSIYQPGKMTQFDKIFARGFAIPVRRPRGGPDDMETAELHRVLSPSSDWTRPYGAAEEDDSVMLRPFIETYGLSPSHPSALSRILEMHDKGSQSRNFIGKINLSREEKVEEYEKYAMPSMERFKSPLANDEGKTKEFQAYLQVYTMSSDDVQGISKLSESAHVMQTISSGPYQGLDKDDSAIQVETAIYEQFNAIDTFAPAGKERIQQELSRRGLDAAGVAETTARSWDELLRARELCSQVSRSPAPNALRGELTSESSLALYASLFDDDTRLSKTDQAFLHGQRVDGKKIRSFLGKNYPNGSFVRAANRLGISVKPHDDIVKSKEVPLYPSTMETMAPPQFGQINDDLFARVDNQFMVFNGAGVLSWHGTDPITQPSRVGEIFASTLTNK